MDVRELRIGNCINRPDLADGLPRFETVIELGSRLVTSGPIKVICDYEDISPIPLTDEVLIRAGFELQGLNHFWKDPVLLIYYVEGTIYLANQKHVNIFYLHQLQNLFYCLTGTELEIK